VPIDENKMEELCESLKDILSGYQARAYIATYVLGEATAYKIAEESGVPRAKVYSALKDLVSKGFIMKTPDDRATLYRAFPPEKIINQKLGQMVSTIESVIEEINDLERNQINTFQELPIIIYNNYNPLFENLEQKEFNEIWFNPRFPELEKLEQLVNKYDLPTNTINNSPILLLAIGSTKAIVIINSSGTGEQVIEFSKGFLHEVLSLTKETFIAKDIPSKQKTGIRILRESSIVDVEDRIKTIIPGFDWKNEPVLFLGTIEKVSGAFTSNTPCDCFITENRILIAADDGRIWARALNFLGDCYYDNYLTTLSFKCVKGFEEITIRSQMYSRIIFSILKVLRSK
jgi:predicted transcriptional regulator